jgi:hypothetical protein
MATVGSLLRTTTKVRPCAASLEMRLKSRAAVVALTMSLVSVFMISPPWAANPQLRYAHDFTRYSL